MAVASGCDNSSFLDRDEIHELLIKLRQPPTEVELSIIMGQLDADGNGEVELSEFMKWWKRVGASKRQELTTLNDKLNEVRDVFDNFDSDASGAIGINWYRGIHPKLYARTHIRYTAIYDDLIIKYAEPLDYAMLSIFYDSKSTPNMLTHTRVTDDD
jgi:hypothetical protein